MTTQETTSGNGKGGRRAVVVGGMRTPFVRAFGELIEMDAIALGCAAVSGLLKKLDLPIREVESIVWGGVILPGMAPNVGREIAIDLGLPPTVEAMTVTRACASGLQAITLGAAAIERGEVDVVVAGGADSTSNAELKFPQRLIHVMAPVALSRKSTPADYLGALMQLSPTRDILPSRPEIAERSTGQVMGEAAEEMAQRNGITRVAQDELAVRSHHRAAAAVASKRFQNEVVAVDTPKGERVYNDTIIRANTSLAQMAKLRPVFSRNGTVTAGNSSALTDGAAAVVLMSEEKARALGYKPQAAFKSWAYVAIDPRDQLLLAPAFAMPKALKLAGTSLRDIDVIDMHEAFAAQVLSVVKMLGSDAFAKQRLDRRKAVGDVDPERLNIHGGSIALGHPFGATGARMVTTVANELALGDKSLALLGICAAGAQGAAAVMERVS
ncbi:MAG: acetyl-CoA C-acyltransferase [Candidatus Schekmanbacteria bacterium]|nr:acetyl-CoA C-acyltransferase [Candidatus Schekmanbacteria bacterium]